MGVTSAGKPHCWPFNRIPSCGSTHSGCEKRRKVNTVRPWTAAATSSASTPSQAVQPFSSPERSVLGKAPELVGKVVVIITRGPNQKRVKGCGTSQCWRYRRGAGRPGDRTLGPNLPQCSIVVRTGRGSGDMCRHPAVSIALYQHY